MQTLTRALSKRQAAYTAFHISYLVVLKLNTEGGGEMGIWAASKAQSASVRIGTGFLDRTIQSGLRTDTIFISPYHLAFLFRLMLHLTSAQLEKDFEDKDIKSGVAVGFDRLRAKHYGRSDELTQNAAEVAFSDDPAATKAIEDADLIISTLLGDDRSNKTLNELVQRDFYWGSAEVLEEAGLDDNQIVDIAFRMMFIESIPN